MATEENNTLIETVRSESDIVRLLEKALANETENTNVKLNFENWPSITLRYTGDRYDATITPEIAEALVGLQTAVNRIYARLAKGEASARGLTAEEKNSIKFEATVGKGSSLIEINLDSFAEKLATTLAGNMSGTQIVFTVGVATAFLACGYAASVYIKKTAETKQLEQTEETKRVRAVQETERLRLALDRSTNALDQPQKAAMAYVKEDADDARHELIKSGAYADTFSIQDETMTGARAKELTRNKRAEAIEAQMNGNYHVTQITWPDGEEEARVRLKNLGTGEEFFATLPDSALRVEQKALFRESSFDRKKLYLTINGGRLRGEVVRASILAVEEQPQKTT